ncbi:MAG TPA: Gfo/Idh/MocA family oxidoreductase [Armatimonadota bacterium]|jgi:UDP-N-acetylglucosamine 3-dehydrogenase|nr:Gfo/Idh/MocA family oxidoreductase [Armatimonadota bacterium]HOM70966.1 Gfo/Idh/MocA family oxidoreductase [Armatimonadota bacterium]
MQRVALVGAGGMGATHAASYGKIQNAKLVAVMDIRPDAAADLAAHYNAKSFSDAQKMFDEVEFDIIDICTPTPWHIDYVKIGAAAGKHVCCEKPFGRTLEQCREAIEACEKAGVTLFIAHVLRWFPEFKKAKELIDFGAIGSPAVVRTTRGGGFPHGWNNWFANFEWSGGAVLDLVIHDFDWLLWTFGPAERVFAKGLYNSGIPEKDYALITIRFRSGVIAHVEATFATPGGFKVSLEVAGDKGVINFDNTDAAPLVIGKWQTESSGPGVPVPSSPMSVSPYYLELQHFVDCIEEGRKPAVTPQEAMDAVALALAAIESIKTGAPVRL